MNHLPVPPQKPLLRQQMRRQRRYLTPAQRHHADTLLASHLATHPIVQAAQRVALYAGFDGEIDPWRHHYRWSTNKTLYLPILHPDGSNRLLFIKAQSPWRKNRFGIIEPAPTSQAAATLEQLDVLLMPLLAFDRQHNRLGAGGGFYDRTLALRQWQRRPVCLGLGYRFQQVEALPLDTWDQPLDGVITD